MDTVDLIGLAVPVTYFVFLATERLWPARAFPPRRGWQWIGVGFLVLAMAISTVIVLGIDPLAAALVGYYLAFNSFFQHWNLRTPQWLGYLIQRPESHCVHHRQGVHYYNYADLPVWDMLFGTFRNPRQYLGECGFEPPADTRLPAMLAFADVNAPLYGPGSLGAKPRPQPA